MCWSRKDYHHNEYEKCKKMIEDRLVKIPKSEIMIKSPGPVNDAVLGFALAATTLRDEVTRIPGYLALPKGGGKSGRI